MKNSFVWILVNCNSLKEAQKIGEGVLAKRLASCFDVFRREQAVYFWPPKSGKKEIATGALLILETLENKYSQVSKVVKSIHSDEMPFIGYIPIRGISKKYVEWIKGEIK